MRWSLTLDVALVFGGGEHFDEVAGVAEAAEAVGLFGDAPLRFGGVVRDVREFGSWADEAEKGKGRDGETGRGGGWETGIRGDGRRGGGNACVPNFCSGWRGGGDACVAGEELEGEDVLAIVDDGGVA